MGIPLVALMGKQPQILDYGQQMAQAQQIQAMKNQNALAPGQLQGQQNELQMQQLQLQQQRQQMQDQQTAMQVLKDNNGDVGKSLPQLAGKISIPSYQALAKFHLDQQKTFSEMDKNELDTQKYHADQLSALGDTAHKLSDEDYMNNWPTLAQKANAIRPDLQLDPNNPMPRQQFDASLLGLKTTAQYAAQAKEQRDAQEQAIKEREQTLKEKEFAAKLPGGGLNAPTETKLALQATSGGPEAATAEAALKRLDQSKRESRPINVTNMGATGVKDIADAIENGDQPPTLQGLYRNGGPVRAELARRGVPIAKMEMDWKATQKYLSTLNGPQQTRLRQDIAVVSDSLDKVEGLYNEWKQIAPTSGFKILNKGSLASMKQLPGRPGAVAQALEAQIADTTAGLGTIYMGGNSPTDHSLGLAAKSLSADWNDATFTEALKQARANVKIRQNSIIHSSPAGVSGNSLYQMPSGGAEQQNTPAATGKTLSMATIQKAAKDHGVSVDEATKQAKAAGYTIQ